MQSLVLFGTDAGNVTPISFQLETALSTCSLQSPAQTLPESWECVSREVRGLCRDLALSVCFLSDSLVACSRLFYITIIILSPAHARLPNHTRCSTDSSSSLQVAATNLVSPSIAALFALRDFRRSLFPFVVKPYRKWHKTWHLMGILMLGPTLKVFLERFFSPPFSVPSLCI